MADDNDDDKTEEATDKRISQALEQGNTPQSREVILFTSFIAYFLVQSYTIPSQFRPSSPLCDTSSTIPPAGV